MEHQQHQIPVLTSLANFAKQASAQIALDNSAVKNYLTVDLRWPTCLILQRNCALAIAFFAGGFRDLDSSL